MLDPHNTVYWDIQFKHRDRKAGKDVAFMIAGQENEGFKALQIATEKAADAGLVMNGDFRIYVYARK